jgi:transcriptional regulator with XRE-family HTH domain
VPVAAENPGWPEYSPANLNKKGHLPPKGVGVTVHFGRLLYRLRLAAGMTQEELGERSGVAVRTIRRLETDPAANPRMGTVRLLADGLAKALNFVPDTMAQLLAGAPAAALELTDRERQVLRDALPEVPDEPPATEEEPGPLPPPWAPGPPLAPWAPRDELDRAADKLARQVRDRWLREEENRRINDPFPLPLRWELADADLTDHWEGICNAAPGETSGPLPLAADLEKIAETYRMIPSGRLVVLGRAGSGKTILALRFVLGYLRSRDSSTEPVPVTFSLGSWDPTAITLRDWLVNLLLRDYPDLAAPAASHATQAAALVAEERILPVLDGFDEIAAGLRGQALEALNATSLRLLLTSRHDEYAQAAAQTRALTRAAGVELADLTHIDLANYLPRTSGRSGPAADHGEAATVWAPVLQQLADDPDARANVSLTAALSTPLMVALARAVYSDRRGRDPRELLDARRFPDRETIEGHLLASFVPTVYRHRPAPLHGGSGHQRLGNWDADHARHWLGCLARHLDRADGRNDGELAWWRLGGQLRRSTRVLAVVVAAALATALIDGLFMLPLDVITSGFAFGVKSGLLDGLLTGPPVGIAFGLIYALVNVHDRAAPEPSRVQLRLLGRRGAARGAERRAGTWGGAGFLGGLAVGIGYGPARTLAVWLLYGIQASAGLVIDITLTNMLLFGLIFGVAGGLGLVLVTIMEQPVDTGTAATPVSLLATNRAAAVRQVLITAPMLAVMIGVGGWFIVSLLQPLLGPLIWSLSSGLMIGVIGGLTGSVCYVLAFTAWGQWLVLARVALPLAGRLPWTPLAFLDGAYQRGVLRQAGAVYQFRHTRLQHHLSHTHHLSHAHHPPG